MRPVVCASARERKGTNERVCLTMTLFDENNDPLAYAESRIDPRRIVEALHTLKPEHPEVGGLSYFGGLTHLEIAERLGHPLGTVKTRKRLGLKRLGEVPGPHLTECPDSGS